GNPAAIRMLVGAGADVNAKDNLRGTTALMWAAEQRHPDAVKMLLEVGADYSARSGPAGLPRNYMAPRVNTAAVRDAARRYAAADLNQTTEYGWTPLLTATNNRSYNLARYLIERGANPNIANKGGWTPLYLATDNRNIEGGDYPVPKPDMDHLELITLLLQHDADPNARAKDNTLTRTIFTMQWFYEVDANGSAP